MLPVSQTFVLGRHGNTFKPLERKDMSKELRAKIAELLNRNVPYDPLYLRAWHIEAKEVLSEVLSNDATVQTNQ